MLSQHLVINQKNQSFKNFCCFIGHNELKSDLHGKLEKLVEEGAGKEAEKGEKSKAKT